MILKEVTHMRLTSHYSETEQGTYGSLLKRGYDIKDGLKECAAYTLIHAEDTYEKAQPQFLETRQTGENTVLNEEKLALMTGFDNNPADRLKKWCGQMKEKNTYAYLQSASVLIQYILAPMFQKILFTHTEKIPEGSEKNAVLKYLKECVQQALQTESIVTLNIHHRPVKDQQGNGKISGTSYEDMKGQNTAAALFSCEGPIPLAGSKPILPQLFDFEKSYDSVEDLIDSLNGEECNVLREWLQAQKENSGYFPQMYLDILTLLTSKAQ